MESGEARTGADMTCVGCGNALDPEDSFCPQCGRPVASPSAADETVLRDSVLGGQVCPRCGATVEAGNMFCTQCGGRIDAARTASGVAGEGDLPPIAMPDRAEAPVPLPAEQAGAQPQAEPMAAPAGSKADKRFIMAIAAIVAAVLVVVIGAFVFARAWNSGVHDAGGDSTTQTQSDSTDGPSGSGSSTACDTAPKATVTSADDVNGGLLLDVEFSSACQSADKDTLDDSGTKITVTDADGNTVAAAVFDFSADPVDLTASAPGARLGFSSGQFWQLADQISPSALTVSVQYGAKGSGAASELQSGAKAGSDALDGDARENVAHAALEQRIKQDKSTASGFYTTYTTQLSSKRLGLKADGKTWTYQDIWNEFVSFRAKYPNSILIWSNDYPTYTKNGPSQWYVTLSGERFATTDAGDSWCTAKGLNDGEHCLVVDLQ
ncbi:zinc-ribbon domain-containing protein [Bifidobacterium sp. SMB2]|uniref:Zinc-ribbon domain-containing protein n=2 Tax=Bifidobacterium TaxID=1678 RepID=A0ABX0C919_9BIFI|nr:zinc-ribbon domain-containing protein [Bifidobacterium sp. SMB2]NEH11191.1 zinc-ribbon domain-containing protein [Bifidobacterium saimiriisciurei]